MVAYIILGLIIVVLILAVILIIKISRKKITDLRTDLSEEQEKLRQEILRSQEKQKQVEDLLKFQANDDRIKSDMETTAEILKNCKSTGSVKNEFKKVSSRIYDIYNTD